MCWDCTPPKRCSGAKQRPTYTHEECDIKLSFYDFYFRPDGFVMLKDLMANPALQNYRYTPSQVSRRLFLIFLSSLLHSVWLICIQIVNTARSDAQQRLEVSQEAGQLLLRSKQQHKPKVPWRNPNPNPNSNPNPTAQTQGALALARTCTPNPTPILIFTNF